MTKQRKPCRWGWMVLLIFVAGSPETWAQRLEFRQRTIDAHPPAKPYYKMVGDLTGDGLPEIVVAGAKGPLVAYRGPNWERVQLAERGWDGVNGEIQDIDRDGHADIVMGGTVWFRNPGDLEGDWEQIRIDDRQGHDVELADLDLDGRLDVIVRDQSAFGKNGNWVALYYQGESPRDWDRTILDCPHGEGIKLADLDRDGDADIVLNGIWLENPRDPLATWKPWAFTEKWQEPDTQVDVGDFNRDGRLDVVLAPAELKGEQYRVCWYQAPANPRATWLEQVVVPEIECVIHSLATGDFDQDGHVDIALAEMHQGADPDEVFVLLNRAGGKQWQKILLSTAGSHDIVAADLDQDGDLDLVGANHAGHHPLEVWLNGGKSRPRP